ncbi:Mu transposase domain-containing protein [Catenibacterium mitsuokai]
MVESCKTRHAYTKGTNEARNKVMDWLRSYSGEFDSIEELQEIVDKLNVKMNTNICQGTQMSPCVLFIKEKEYLTPLPDRTVLDGYLSPHKVKVSSQQLVYFNGAQYSVDRKYIDEYVSVETFDDMLQVYYKGKLIQVHTISRNPINYTKKHYEQSISKQLVGKKDFSKVIANNLSIMDKLLDSREIVLTRNDALKSYDHMIAYLVSQESLSFWIKRFIQTLNKEERKTFYIEVSKILLYITDEEQFFSALKKSANKNELNIFRVNLWGFGASINLVPVK